MSALHSESRWPVVAHNLRRLMAREGLGDEDVVERTGLDRRTLRGIVKGDTQPHAKTLHRLAEGLGVEADALFAVDETTDTAEFDAATNPAIDEAIAKEPELFEGWSPAEFNELASRFGEGGPLTVEGALESARAMNENRATIARARVVLESDEAATLRGIVDALYERVQPEE